MRALAPTQEGFFDTPDVIRVSGALPASCARVFETLAAPEPWPEWLRIVRHIEYTTSPPHAPGTRRDLRSLFGYRIREHFSRWDAGAGFTFFVYETNIPGLVQFGEDYRLTAITEDSCRLEWATRMVIAPWARPFGPLSRSMFAREARLGVVRLAEWLKAH